MESWTQSWRPRTNAFCHFSTPPAPATKKWCQVIQSAAPVTQNHLPKPEDLMLQNAACLRKSAAWPLTSLMNMSLVLRLPREIHLCRSSSNACHRFWKCYKALTFCSLLAGWRILCACHTKRRFNVQKWREHVVFCTFLTSKCTSRHNGVHFLNIATSKSVLRLTCFVRFDFEMYFAPQRRALFEHRNFQKCSEANVLCPLWLRNVLRATTACTFWTSQLPKVLRTRRALHALTSKCASRHNIMHFLNIATSESAPNAACFVHVDFDMCFAPQHHALFPHHNCQKCSGRGAFSFFTSKLSATMACNFSSLIRPDGSAPAALASLLFDPLEPQIIGKHTVNRDLRTCIFFLLTLSLLWSYFFFSSLLWLFPPLLFHLSILSEVWLLNFLR